MSLLKRIASLAGGLLAIAAIVWVLRGAMLADWSRLDGVGIHRLVATVSVGALIYALLGGALAYAWQLSLRAFGAPSEGQMRIYALSQVYKYLPGNVMHLLGRHGLGARAGASHAALVSAGLVEIGLLLVAAVLIIGVAGHGFVFETLAAYGLQPQLLWLIGGVGLVSVVASLFLLPRLFSRVETRSPRLPEIIPIFFLYGLYCLGCGVVGFGVLTFGFGVEIDAGLAISAFVSAWAIGFVTPGAPAGLGVREAVLVAIIGPTAGAEAALAAAALFRGVTIAGDALLALLGLAANVPVEASRSNLSNTVTVHD